MPASLSSDASSVRARQSAAVAALQADLAAFVDPARLIDDPLHLLAYGTDASFYRLVPQLVVKVVDEVEVSRLLALARAHRTPVTFRAAGTSLSGQAITDSVLVMLDGNAWRDYAVSGDAAAIRLQPGIIGAQANAYLLPFARKIGPDPASIATCKIGGIAANNASGMCCGVAQNSYQTLASMRVILADGSVLDTADEASRAAFRRSHGDLLDGLAALVAEVRGNPALAERIAHKYRIKNTTGYSLNALVDYDDPIDVLQHLMIGSEGTLGFIAEITYRTVPEYPYKATALAFFADIGAACEAVARLRPEPVDAVEIMDRAALRSVQDRPGMPPGLTELPDGAAALLIETRAPAAAQLAHQVAHLSALLNQAHTIEAVVFTERPDECARLWQVRKGMFPSVGAVRDAGTTVVIEDIAFPLSRLAEGTLDLQALFERHGYRNAIIFGHALEGNLHFVITPDFGKADEVARYHAFMDALCHLVVERYDGSLKAEHSTGRNMAPYVELEWGAEAYALMRRIKRLFDPDNLLNPGVILNDDPQVHVRDLKSMAAVDPLVDRCIECGFCEPVCPSRELTVTPRQRIVLLREQARLAMLGVDGRAALTGLDYAVDDTCAGDGLCATRCPVGIDTGQMVRTLRARDHGPLARRLAGWADRHMAATTAATRGALALAHRTSRVIGEVPLERLTGTLRRWSGGRLPEWHRWMPRAARRPSGVPAQGDAGGAPEVVYFSACVTRSLGPASADRDEDRDLRSVMLALLAKAGLRVLTASREDGLCCGLPFKSKGLNDSAERAAALLEQALWLATDEGRLPVLCDTSPCTLRMREAFVRPFTVYEPVGFIRRFLLPRLAPVEKVDSIALHVTCSARKMGLEDDFLAVAEACAQRVVVAEEEGCCGFAGDKGFSVPELNASALVRLRQQIPSDCRAGYSNSRTCEIGLSRHTGIPFRSLAYLVDRCFDAPRADE